MVGVFLFFAVVATLSYDRKTTAMKSRKTDVSLLPEQVHELRSEFARKIVLCWDR
jgi:hypothetical protein